MRLQSMVSSIVCLRFPTIFLCLWVGFWRLLWNQTLTVKHSSNVEHVFWCWQPHSVEGETVGTRMWGRGIEHWLSSISRPAARPEALFMVSKLFSDQLLEGWIWCQHLPRSWYLYRIEWTEWLVCNIKGLNCGSPTFSMMVNKWDDNIFYCVCLEQLLLVLRDGKR